MGVLLKEKELNAKEKEFKEYFLDMFKLVGGDDYEKSIKDKDYKLWTDLTPQNVLKGYPDVAIVTAEYCPYRASADEFVKNLEKAGKLLEYSVQPGCGHMFPFNPNARMKQSAAEFRLILEVYVLGK